MHEQVSRRTHLAIVIGAFVAGLLSVLLLILFVTGKDRETVLPAPSAVGGPFRLVDQNSQQVTDETLKGRPFLVFFGFTHCPDICPTTLFEISEILRQLGPDGDRLKALFVTVDPERDTPEKLKDYLSSFDPRLGALTGTPEQVAAMTKAYRVYARKVPLQGGDYTMDHTALVYLMDKQGRFIAPFNVKRKPEEAAAELRKYL
jgi:protein SCO1/2